MAGLGGQNDKSLHTTKDDFELTDDDSLAAVYMSDGLGRRIIDAVADDMTREWIYLDDEEDEEEATGAASQFISFELFELIESSSCK